MNNLLNNQFDIVYKNAPIKSTQSLCKALEISEPRLRSIAARASKLYIGPISIPKKNGLEFRDVYKAKPVLKNVLDKIKNLLIQGVNFPFYLHGSIPKRGTLTNANMHKNARRVITEDIQSFFDSITEKHIFSIWHNCFKFSSDVATLLTQLTTKDGTLCQGAATSSYLANFVFWKIEPIVAKKLLNRGLKYSRYVDDITITTSGEMSEEDKQWSIAQVYAMVGRLGLKIRREKHTGSTSRFSLAIMGVNINTNKLAKPKPYRSAVRAQVFQLEKLDKEKLTKQEINKLFSSASTKVGTLGIFHKRKSLKLKERIKKAKNNTDVMLKTGDAKA